MPVKSVAIPMTDSDSCRAGAVGGKDMSPASKGRILVEAIN